MKTHKILAIVLSTSLLIACGEDSIVKDNPIITWDTPSDISKGTQLTTIQLNASAEIPGTFVYTPELGTSLDAGTSQTLSVEFTPDDVATQNIVTQTVSINVTAGSDAVFNSGISYGLAVDIDGNEYKTVTIGNQTWMAENLRVTRYRNGDVITEVTNNVDWTNLTEGGVSNYENTTDLDEIATNGRLYNWAAVTDSRNIAPEGWHVATDAEWTTLTNALGGEIVAGGKLKESGQSHWNSPNTSADNSSGFTGLPSGRREYSDGTFLNLGFNTFWWTSTTYDGNYAWYRFINYNESNLYRANFHSTYGYSVRCVKD